MGNVFSKVRIDRPGRSAFDLSHEIKLTCDMGQLIPICLMECIPGDIFKIAQQIVGRLQPTVAPILHLINIIVHFYHVPYRILWNEWEDFITGGPTGESVAVLPRWEPTNTNKYSLWDYCGFPVGVDPDGAYPLDFVRRAYNAIYNAYYRDQSLIAEVALDNEEILLSAWEKDYFTSALLTPQRGIAPAMPVVLSGSAEWEASDFESVVHAQAIIPDFNGANTTTPRMNVNDAEGVVNALNFFNANTLDAVATTFDVNDLRLAFQIQKFLERNNRIGSRYTEFLWGQFGIAPRDERLQRPEYIGGLKQPFIISEVLQTSESNTTPQGTMAGHGISMDGNYIGKYHVKEFGLIMGIMKIMPKSNYSQGINRQWLRRTKYDWPFPVFTHIGEQAIERAEIYASDVEAENTTIFGYQGRYDELRVMESRVVADMRDTFNYWHLAREFSTPPLLNQSFIECDPDSTKRIFAVQNEPGFIMQIGNIVKAIRPIPSLAEPGLIDHF